MKVDPLFKADLARYPARTFLREQSIWAIWVYRFGRRNDLFQRGFAHYWRNRLYWFLFRIVETLTGISIPKEADIGPGLRIFHFGNIFLHPQTRIGVNCTLRQGVTIGNRREQGPVPRLGDSIEVGAYAQILGDITIGDHAKIGAMSLVLRDVPAGATAVGNPARIISPGAPQ
jgi:serine O-acetyltransferase